MSQELRVKIDLPLTPMEGDPIAPEGARFIAML